MQIGSTLQSSNHRLGVYGCVLILGFVASSQVEAADDVCSIVLKADTLNRTDYSQNAHLFQINRDSVCKREFNSAGEAYQEGRAAGGSIAGGAYSLKASEAKSIGSNKFSIAESNFCSASAAELEASTGTSLRTQVADIALKTWLECVKTVSSGSTTYMEYEVPTGAMGVFGKLYRYIGASGGALGYTITGVTTTPEAVDIKCRFGTRHISTNVELKQPLEVRATPLGFACEKSPQVSVVIQIHTNQGDLKAIQSPSVEIQAQSAKDDIANQLAVVKSELVRLRASVDTNAKSADDRLKALRATVLTDYATTMAVEDAVERGVTKASENLTNRLAQSMTNHLVTDKELSAAIFGGDTACKGELAVANAKCAAFAASRWCQQNKQRALGIVVDKNEQNNGQLQVRCSP